MTTPLVGNPHVVQKEWGNEMWMVNREEYCGKILTLNSYSCGSNHYHKNKTESFYVLDGLFSIIFNNEEKPILLLKGMTLHVPRNTPHKIMNLNPTGRGRLIETSTMHDDADSYRLDEESPFYGKLDFSILEIDIVKETLRLAENL